MDELQFKKIIIKLRSLAKSQGGRVTKEQVSNMFLPLDIKEEQLSLVYGFLKEEKIRVLDSAKELEEQAEDNKKSSSVKMNKNDSEYLKMYISELEGLNIPSQDERSVIISDVLNDINRASEVIPSLYLKEVVDIARLYEGQGVPLEDLVGEGNVGILTGLKMIDCCESAREVEEFMTKMIMDSMESLIMEKFTGDDFDIKILERVNTINDKAKEMAEDLERLVTVSEVAAELGLDEEYILETMRISGNTIDYIKN